MSEQWNTPDKKPAQAEGILKFRSVHVWAKLSGKENNNKIYSVYYFYKRQTWMLTDTFTPVEIIEWHDKDGFVPENVLPEYMEVKKRSKKFSHEEGD